MIEVATLNEQKNNSRTSSVRQCDSRGGGASIMITVHIRNMLWNTLQLPALRICMWFFPPSDLHTTHRSVISAKHEKRY